MRVAIVMTAEATPAYDEMVDLATWSVRRRAGALADAELAVVYNDAASPDAERRLAPRGVSVEARPRLSQRMRCMNKYNALFAPATEQADWTILLDADTAVIRPLDELAARLDADDVQFAAAPVNAARVWGLETLVRENAGLEEHDIAPHRTDDRHGLPYFNGGMLAIRRDAVPAFRERVIDESRRLFDRMRASSADPVHWGRVQWNRFAASRNLDKRWMAGPHFAKGYADQVAIVVAMMALRLRYRVLERRFNWVTPELSGPAGPTILHYLSARYPIDRARLLDGDWSDDYADSDDPGRQALAALVEEYRAERRSA